MTEKRIGDYIDYDFHTPNTKEVREFLEGEFVTASRAWSKFAELITPNIGLDFVFTTHKEWGKFIPTEEFKQLIGMTKKEENVVNKGNPEGYQLADGSYSSEYSIGDKFVVVNDSFREWERYAKFSIGSIVELCDGQGDFGSPLFKLLEGECDYHHAPDDYKGAYTPWKNVKAHKPAFTKVDFTKSDLKDGMIVTTRNGNVYTVTGDRMSREGGMYILLEDINDDLTSVLDDIRTLDIISVQQTLFKRETEADLKQQRIAKELEFAEAKRERLNTHIERLKKNLQN